jgi:hypothetical protein
MQTVSFKILKSASLLLLLILILAGCRKSSSPVDITETITDNGGGIGTTTWTKDKTYIIEGFVFVNEGQTLTIEPGTVIRGRTGQAESASALIVARDGKIIAEGTPQEPIIFTVDGDDLQGSVPVSAKGLWGGVIILGRARLNSPSGEAHIEGIPLSEDRGIYGGLLDDDDSGILKYISIRHGGTNIGEGNEINGLTLGGVGSATQIENIEIISNLDDGVECFGGNVNLRNIVVSYCGDDAFDMDLGYHGKAQFLLGIQAPETGDKLIEITGGEGSGYGLPYTLPRIANFTGIGRGFNSASKIATISANGAGNILNSIFTDQDLGMFIEYTEFQQDSYKNLQNSTLLLRSNIFQKVADNDADRIFEILAEPGLDVSDQEVYLNNYYTLEKNNISDYGIGISGDQYKISPDSNIFPDMAPNPDNWFTDVDYKGAFLGNNWLIGWTLISEEGKIEF